MNLLKTLSTQSPIITVSSPFQTIPQTPRPTYDNPFDTMTATETWESLVDEHIALAKECQKSDCPETLEKLMLTPTFDAVVHNGGTDGDGGDDSSSETKLDIRALQKETVQAGRKAYDAFHEVVEGLKKGTPKDDWEDKIGAAAMVAKDAMVAALEKFAIGSKDAIRLVPDEDERVESAKYFNYCVNGYVLFVRKVNEVLELVYEARKGGQQRVWTALETAGRVVHDAEGAVLKWVVGQNVFAAPGVSFQT